MIHIFVGFAKSIYKYHIMHAGAEVYGFKKKYNKILQLVISFETKLPCAWELHGLLPIPFLYLIVFLTAKWLKMVQRVIKGESKHISATIAQKPFFKPETANDKKYFVFWQIISSADISVGFAL